jgi:hypothetical protein
VEQQICDVIRQVFFETGKLVDAETLADLVRPRMFCTSEEFRATDYLERCITVLNICRRHF